MTTKGYNDYIKNYLENDKTNSAIMLTAPWGMGKSYYIQNELIPYINGDNGNKCICVSLYGLKSLDEVSKALYLEIRAKKFIGKNEKTAIAKVIGKTIIKGVASFFGVEIDISEKDLKRLYASIDLSGKLIILEDLERANIDIIQLMGYINNLVEQDGVKVLLVANESELLKYDIKEEQDDKGRRIQNKVLTEESNDYLRIKEKTVSDTIVYLCDYYSTIYNILKGSNNVLLNSCLKEANAKKPDDICNEISEIMNELKIWNFRSLIFACQKTIDLFKALTFEINNEFFKFTFLGIVAFSLRLKQNDKLEWNKDNDGFKLGARQYPLCRFCYNFIKYQSIDIVNIEAEQTSFLRRLDFERQQNELSKFMVIIRSFTSYEEEKVDEAVAGLKEMLTKTDIPVDEYIVIANYLIAIKDFISYPNMVDECKKIMLDKLKKKQDNGEELNSNTPYFMRFQLWTEEQKKEYKDFLDEVDAVKKEQESNLYNFNYNVNELESFLTKVENNRGKFLQLHCFAKYLDCEKFIALVSSCSVAQLSSVRYMFTNTVYGFANISDYYSRDKKNLQSICDGCKQLLARHEHNDKIYNLVLNWFIDDLNGIIGRL